MLYMVVETALAVVILAAFAPLIDFPTFAMLVSAIGGWAITHMGE